MENELPKRKPTRLKDFDYSTPGAYFITICTQDRRQLLSEIVLSPREAAVREHVGEGLAPPAAALSLPTKAAMPDVQLKPCGRIAEQQLLLLEDRYTCLTVEDYIIMPDHIHAILFLHKPAGGASPSPTLHDVVCAFKSLTARICKQQYGIDRLFQRSFAEHVIRDQDDYAVRKKYIVENPLRWFYQRKEMGLQK